MCKQSTKTVGKYMLQTRVNIFLSENTALYVSTKKLQEMDLWP